MTVLVTAATGKLGRLVVDRLLARGVAPDAILAGARSPERAAPLAELGVTVVPLDYDDPAGVRAAVAGADRVLLVSAPEPGRRLEQHRSVIDAAAATRVELLAYTSLTRATESPLPLAPEHVATERAIAGSGVPAAILRNDWYTENYAGDLTQAADTGLLVAAVGDGRVASASRADYADAAAAVLTGEGHAGRIYELAGDVAWTYADLAAAMSDVLGRPVEHRSPTPEERAAQLAAAGLDAGTVDFVIGLETGIRDGALDVHDPALPDLIGRPTTPLVDGLRALAAGRAAS